MTSRTWDVLKDLRHFRRIHLIDLLVIAGVAGVVFGLFDVGREWTQPMRQTVEIDLDSPGVLLRYTFFSLSRGLIAYVLSLFFSLAYGYWAAKDPVAERVLVPLLDILQSIPVLSFLPGLVLALVALFPSSNIGLEMAAILMIFTGQVWNMTFSFYHSLKSVPQEQREVFVAHEIEGRSFSEIAAATGVSINTLLARKRYAVLHLRKRLQNLYDGFTKG